MGVEPVEADCVAPADRLGVLAWYQASRAAFRWSPDVAAGYELRV